MITVQPFGVTYQMASDGYRATRTFYRATQDGVSVIGTTSEDAVAKLLTIMEASA